MAKFCSHFSSFVFPKMANGKDGLKDPDRAVGNNSSSFKAFFMTTVLTPPCFNKQAIWCAFQIVPTYLKPETQIGTEIGMKVRSLDGS